MKKEFFKEKRKKSSLPSLGCFWLNEEEKLEKFK